MNAWQVEADKSIIRRLGKLCEELNECGSAASRAIIQGVDSVSPDTGKTNRQWLLEELADVQAQIGCTLLHLGLDQDFLARRVAHKMKQMDEWEDLLKRLGK